MKTRHNKIKVTTRWYRDVEKTSYFVIAETRCFEPYFYNKEANILKTFIVTFYLPDSQFKVLVLKYTFNNSQNMFKFIVFLNPL